MNNKYVIYTDGSSRGNPGPGGWAAVVIEDNYGGQRELVHELGGRENMTTNNRMEMTAAIEALKYIDRNFADTESVEVFSDSEYLINGITIWIKNWQKNNWKTKNKKEVLNKDLWEKLLAETEGKNIKWKKVLGHSGHKLNDRCDEIATCFADGFNVDLYDGSKEDY